MEKTAMTILYDKVHSSMTDIELIDWIGNNRVELFSKERQDLEDFWNEGYGKGSMRSKISASDYYNNKYGEK